MTRTFLFALLLSVSALAWIASPSTLRAQSTKGAPASDAAPRAAAKGTTYGPVLRTQAPQGAAGNKSSIRRAAGDEPVREPAPGAKPAGPKAGPARPANRDILPLDVSAAPRQPAWYPLSPEMQKWTDEILSYWETSSEQIVTFKCAFERWEHDPAFGPADPTIPFTYSTGIIQYAKPDKGMFKVEKLMKYGAPKEAGGEAEWLEQNQIGEHWVCDGRSIFEYDIRGKKVVQRILPKEMQGKAIADGPLPFLFGAKAATINSRYWIRVLDPPKDRKGEYWLEAIPRYRQDAGNFQKVKIVLDEKDFLPKALDVFAPNYNFKTNPAHTAYALSKRETTLKGDKKLLNLDFLNLFKREFYEPKVPSGWKKVVEDMNAIPPGPLPVQGPRPGTAAKPGTKKTK